MANVLDDIRNQFKTGTMTTRLIYINVAVFLIISIINVIIRLSAPSVAVQLDHFVYSVFTLKTSFKGFLTHPWGIITSIFTHFGLLHFAFNMLMLYSMGRLFEHYLGARKLLATYILGGLVGNALELLAQSSGIVPGTSVIGASGAVFSIIFALAAYVPTFQISIFGLFNINLRTLAIILFLVNILSIGTNSGTAYFAHLGGALFGYFAIRNQDSRSNILNRFGNWFYGLKNPFKKGPKIKVVKDDFKKNAAQMKDEDYNAAKKKHQERTNVILDKISKSGYESLTKEEKDFLFQQSNNA